jgi:RNA polymerase sigma-70 factor (sigma-E family)
VTVIVGGIRVDARWDADEAVTELYSRHYRGLVRLAALLLRDPWAAEEVVQDAFVALHSSWRRIREEDKALAYLRQTVVNKSRSALRHRAVVERHTTAEEYLPSAEAATMVRLDADAVLVALQALSPRQREALVLRYWADLPEAEVAAAMRDSTGSVKTHPSRGLTALRTRREPLRCTTSKSRGCARRCTRAPTRPRSPGTACRRSALAPPVAAGTPAGARPWPSAR